MKSDLKKILNAVKESNYTNNQKNILKKAQQNAFFEKEDVVKPRMTLPVNKTRKNVLNEEENMVNNGEIENAVNIFMILN